MTPTQLQTLVNNKVNECFEVAKKQYPDHTFPTPIIKFDLTGSVGGTAQSKGNGELRFNMTFLENHTDAYLTTTVPHEVAHLIDDIVNLEYHLSRQVLKMKRDVHGKPWKDVMNVLGANPKRCHSYDTSSMTTVSRTYLWKCDICDATMHLKKIRHNRMMNINDTTSYKPRTCTCPWGEYTATYIPTEADVPKTDTVVPTNTDVPKGTTIASRAADIFNKGMSRKQFIDLCIMNNIKKTTASTYFAKLNRG